MATTTKRAQADAKEIVRAARAEAKTTRRKAQDDAKVIKAKAREQAQKIRDKARQQVQGPPEDRPRALKFLHTRVPQELETRVKAEAARLRIPVSNLIRNTLEDAFGSPKGKETS